jgi:hypothetical protein
LSLPSQFLNVTDLVRNTLLEAFYISIEPR